MTEGVKDPAPAPAGRGRGTALPAWMTKGVKEEFNPSIPDQAALDAAANKEPTKESTLLDSLFEERDSTISDNKGGRNRSRSSHGKGGKDQKGKKGKGGDEAEETGDAKGKGKGKKDDGGKNKDSSGGKGSNTKQRTAENNWGWDDWQSDGGEEKPFAFEQEEDGWKEKPSWEEDKGPAPPLTAPPGWQKGKGKFGPAEGSAKAPQGPPGKGGAILQTPKVPPASKLPAAKPKPGVPGLPKVVSGGLKVSVGVGKGAGAAGKATGKSFGGLSIKLPGGPPNASGGHELEEMFGGSEPSFEQEVASWGQEQSWEATPAIQTKPATPAAQGDNWDSWDTWEAPGNESSGGSQASSGYASAGKGGISISVRPPAAAAAKPVIAAAKPAAIISGAKPGGVVPARVPPLKPVIAAAKPGGVRPPISVRPPGQAWTDPAAAQSDDPFDTMAWGGEQQEQAAFPVMRGSVTPRPVFPPAKAGAAAFPAAKVAFPASKPGGAPPARPVIAVRPTWMIGGGNPPGLGW